ncbi:MAG: Putative FMN hydrolase; 5-Amino-6-(5'-phosphoribitylamino)uracil phosphatase [uncultured Rubrobacteraceae bacterium]|uniref:FMN hydrolase 5-Amino-6-(5'-phosphoribitylamino)uracil phosphatase n=1 Tax=uncultured Rubrobacteraceae bacterium TaxID=349277 RepID=A0A6J4R0V1_9ACTN|nr:MAG: Putative FMN hydrolase; 5-Amino-6-(5'-phosphoribitylamino)uracil phosphatase [uncultured Rubrobacteraceae bacterium]
MPEALGFDIYGTLVDPLEMDEHLREMVGEGADRFSALWREKQIEYTWRRGLMREYADFGVCTRQALDFAALSFGLEISDDGREGLVEEYQNLRPFPDVLCGLERLRSEGHTMVAFSNGVERTARVLLERAGVLDHLEAVVSVDDLGTFKPDPEVYRYLARRLDRPVGETWLVSSNGWDVIGAKSAGLRAAWVRRNPATVFDPWGIEADLVVENLEQLVGKL